MSKRAISVGKLPDPPNLVEPADNDWPALSDEVQEQLMRQYLAGTSAGSARQAMYGIMEATRADGWFMPPEWVATDNIGTVRVSTVRLRRDLYETMIFGLNMPTDIENPVRTPSRTAAIDTHRLCVAYVRSRSEPSRHRPPPPVMPGSPGMSRPIDSIGQTLLGFPIYVSQHVPADTCMVQQSETGHFYLLMSPASLAALRDAHPDRHFNVY